MSEELKTCPFCGGEVDFWTRQAHEAEEYQALIIDCKDCLANMEEWVYKYDKNFAENFEKKKAEMFEAWNKRVVTDTNDGSKERTAKVYKKQAPDKLYYFYCGVCGEMIDCSSYEDYKSIKLYCGYCGAKLEWSDDE